jgi:cell division protein FtsB
MARKAKKRKVGLIPKLILLAFVIYSVVTLVSLQIKIKAQKSESERLQREIEAELSNQAQLKQIIEAPVDDEYIRTEAQKQGYAAPDEQIFVDTSGK